MGRLDRDPELIRRYHEVLAQGEIPKFLYEYAATSEMQRLAGVGSNCGMNYTRLYDNYQFFYDSLSHSLSVAIITWRFMHRDRTAALAALFHDIATPCFKHCIDFMFGDSEKQESTEGRTEEIIWGSKEICTLLERDGIPIEKVLDYKDYWAADNELPRFSADRIDYTLNYGLMTGVWSLEDIDEICGDMTEVVNEDYMWEIGFANLPVAEKYILGAAKCWPRWFDSANRLSMKIVAEVVAAAISDGKLELDDLWQLPEEMIVARLREESELWRNFEGAFSVVESRRKLFGRVVRGDIQSKRRWTDPIVSGVGRLSDISDVGAMAIERYFALKPEKWARLVF